jgi:hypothetical protein
VIGKSLTQVFIFRIIRKLQERNHLHL